MHRLFELHSNDETQISLQVLPVPLQNLRFCARVSSQILLAFSQVLQETPALAPSPTKKTAPQFLRRFHSKTCKVTLFSRVCTQNLRASHFLAICPFPTNTAKPATHSTKSAIDLTLNSCGKNCKTCEQFLRQNLQNYGRKFCCTAMLISCLLF